MYLVHDPSCPLNQSCDCNPKRFADREYALAVAMAGTDPERITYRQGEIADPDYECPLKACRLPLVKTENGWSCPAHRAFLFRVRSDAELADDKRVRPTKFGNWGTSGTSQRTRRPGRKHGSPAEQKSEVGSA
jgi:hypothetical protein